MNIELVKIIDEKEYYQIQITGNSYLDIHIKRISEDKSRIYPEYKNKLIIFKNLKLPAQSQDKDFSEIKKLILKNNNIVKLENDGKNLKLSIILPIPYSITISEIFQLLNIEYYIAFGPKYKRINKEPFYTSLNSDSFNINNLREVFKNDKIIEKYNIDTIRYYDKNLKGFIRINESTNIQMTSDILILELHCNKLIDPIKSEFIRNDNNIRNAIKRINNKFKISQKNTEYDMIYLYASPIYDGTKSIKDQINYRKEIKSIIRIFNNSGKALNCLFECANEKTFSDILIQNKIKILHIASHGELVKKDIDTGIYNLILENNAKPQNIQYNKLEKILMTNSSKLKKIDLVVLATCHSEDLGLLFKKYGANNVIYITRPTPISDLAALKFSEYFYEELIKMNSIQTSFKKAIEKLKVDRGIDLINRKSNCKKNHSHKNDELCLLLDFKLNEKNCTCNYHEANKHKLSCEYYKKIKENLISKMKIKTKEQNYYKEFPNEKYAKICCCDYNIPHCEDLKFKLYSKIDIIPFQNSENGILKVNKNCILYDLDYYKSLSILVRGRALEEIYNIITDNKIHFIIIYGDKEIGKQDFAESSCIYLLERKIINNFEKIELNSKYDIEYIINKSSNANEKNILIIKISYLLDEKFSFKNTSEILKINVNYTNLYYIIILATQEENEDIIRHKLNNQDGLKNEYKLINLNLDLDSSHKLLQKYCDFLGYNSNINNLNEKLKDELLIKVKCHPKQIKILADLIGQKKESKIEELNKTIKEIKDEEILNEQLIKENKIYYLLSIMPFGLPSSLIKLIYPHYENFLIKKDIINDLIYKDLNDNWYYVKEIKKEIHNFPDEDKKDCISKCLIVFSKLFYFYIEKNRQNICFPDGNIHYIFNSYNDVGIWKTFDCGMFQYCFCFESNKKEYTKILNDELKIDRYMKNIMSLMLNNIDIIKNLIEKSFLKEYVEQILIMLPSIYFLDKNCKAIIEKCLFLTDKLGLEDSKKRLLIFSNSLEKDIELDLEQIKSDNIKDLELEAEFLNALKKRNKEYLENVKNNMENIISKTSILKATNFNDILLKKCYLFYEMASLDFNNNNFEEAKLSLEKAKEAAINIDNYFFVDRINIDLFLIEQKNIEQSQISQNEKQNKIEESFSYLDEVLNQKYYNKKLKSYLFNEAYNLKLKFSKISEPDILILNSNPLTNYYGIISNGIFTYQNNQYYLLEKINKKIKMDIKIESNLLNKENLNKALNKEGEILIIQSDDYTENGEIMLESNKGESEKLLIEEMKSLLPVKIKYKIVILCFINSGKLKQYFEDKVQYLITFDYIDCFNFKSKFIFKYNQLSIDFLVDFIEKTNDTSEKKSNNIEFSFKQAKELFAKRLKDYNIKSNLISLWNESGLKGNIKYNNSKIHEKIVLNPPLLYLPENIPRCKDYSNEILELIDIIISGNKQFINIYLNNDFKIHENGSKNLNKKSKISVELIKFFHRHQTFKKIYYIHNPQKYGITLNEVIDNFLKAQPQDFVKDHGNHQFSSLLVVNNYEQKKKNYEKPINLLNDIQYLVMTKYEIKFSNIKDKKYSYREELANKIIEDNENFYQKSLKKEIVISKKSMKKKIPPVSNEKEDKNILKDLESIFKYSFDVDKDYSSEDDLLRDD